MTGIGIRALSGTLACAPEQGDVTAPPSVTRVHTARHRRRRIMTTSSRNVSGSRPWLHQKGEVIQDFGTVKQFPLGLSYEARWTSTQASSSN